MIIDPCMGLPFFDNPQFCQDAKLPLHSLQGEAGLMHDLPLVIRLPGMGAKKVENPRSRCGTKEFHQLLFLISHVCLVGLVRLIGWVGLLHPSCASKIFPKFHKPCLALTE
jgi:hypothetical protein